MVLSTDQQRDIAWRSKSLTERLKTQHETQHAPSTCPESITDTQLAAEWIKNTPMQSEKTLCNRPIINNTSKETLLHVSGRNTHPKDVSLPDWVYEIGDVINTITDTKPLHVHSFYKNTSDVPFIHFTSSVITHAIKDVTGTLTTIPEDCLTGAFRELYHDLTGLLAETLFTEFQTYKAFNAPEKLNTPSDGIETTSTDAYTDFIETLHTEERLIELFTEYPVLPRLIVTRLSQWCENIQQFDKRLNEDWEALANTFDFDTEESLTAVTVLSSDRHNGGKRVIELTVSTGRKLVYKPRSVTTNTVFDQTVEYLANNTTTSYTGKTVLERDEYGYVEHTPPQDCTDTEQITAYYKRIGCVIAAAYILHFTDCHYENIIANGEIPSVIDTETVYAPELQFTTTEGHTDKKGALDTGIMQTGLLPQQYTQQTIPAEAKINGLSEPKAPVTGTHIETQWENTNTDYMQPAQDLEGNMMTPPPRNLPTINGDTHGVTKYTRDVRNTFHNALQPLTEENKQDTDAVIESVTPDTPISVRVITRPTREYADVLSTIQSPETLRDGVEMTYAIDTLLTEEMMTDTTHDKWKLFNQERNNLLHLDVPRFETTTHSHSVHNTPQTGKSLIRTPGVERVRDRIQSLTATDIARQEDFITAACNNNPTISPETRVTPRTTTHNTQYTFTTETNTESVNAVTSEVERIFDQVIQHSEMHNNAITWLTKQRHETGRFTVTHSNNSLYEGRGGIGVFAAAVAAITDNITAERTAKQIAKTILKTRDETSKQNHALGLGNGVFGTAYAMFTIGRLLENDSFISASENMLQDIPENKLNEWEAVDVMGGVAGGLLTTITMQKQAKSTSLNELIEKLGDRLIAVQETSENHGVWTGDGFTTPLTGFAHGVSGIGYALTRAYEHTDNNTYKQAAETAVTFTHSQYDPTRNNWTDLRPHASGTEPADAWCYGRTGITTALAEIDAYNTEISERIDADMIQNAIDASTIVTNASGSQLCCGAAGRLQLHAHHSNNTMLTHVDRSSILTVAQDIVEERCERPWYELECHSDVLYNASLFQGTAGIGYSLLHATYPEILPTILLVK